MAGDYLLDTNIIVAIMNLDPALDPHKSTGARLYVPSIVVGELHYGARKSARQAENIARIDAYLLNAQLLDCDHAKGRFTEKFAGNCMSKGGRFLTMTSGLLRPRFNSACLWFHEMLTSLTLTT